MRVLIKPDLKEGTIGNVVIPEKYREYTHRATVIATGEGRPDDPILVKEGDVVLYSKERYFPFVFEGEDYFIVFQDAIHCVL